MKRSRKNTAPRHRVRFVKVLIILSCVLLAGTGCAPKPVQRDTRCEIDSMVARVGEENPLVDEHVIEWDRYEVLADDCLLVHFTTGGGEAFAYRYAMEKDSLTIIISVIEGTILEAPQSWKVESHEESLVVRTEAAIGSRTVTTRR